MNSSLVKALTEAGQSIWLDYIRRDLTRSGELARRVETDGLRGVTSNPSIFRASMGGDEYAQALPNLCDDPDRSTQSVYEALAVEDIQEACDTLLPVYESTRHADGFVSFEVSPRLSTDAEGTVAEAQRLWRAVARRNLMIKVPGTPAGVAALEQLITEGINVNVTLIFDRKVYQNVAEAYLRGLQKRVEVGKPVADIASVASFFVSRIDTEVDKQLEAIGTPDALALCGSIAIANAKLAYQSYRAGCESEAWLKLAALGAQPQRLLWASTGTKNPAYSDVLYVEQLIGPQTVNTLPPKTLAAFLDHGRVEPTLTADLVDAERRLEQLAKLNISLADIAGQLLRQGLAAFEGAMDDLLATVAERQRALRGARLNRTATWLPPQLQAVVDETARTWAAKGQISKIWAKDAAVWTGSSEDSWLGWLDIVQDQLDSPSHLTAFASDLRSRGIRDIVLLGMGGSSLCPDVLAKTFGPRGGGPTLRIVDSTVPAQVARIAATVDYAHTMFIVASKSGTTLEPTVLLEYFLDAAQRARGDAAAKHFVAITDPGSKLEAFAAERGFGATYKGVPDIGGRYSAFSNFGMIPAAGIGLDTGAFLAEAKLMANACTSASPRSNPGALLGLILGVAAGQGRNKLTLLTSPAISSFGAWVEQLVAESTGKHGQAIIPVDGEVPSSLNTGSDRLFVYIRLGSTPDPTQDRIVAQWRDRGEPVVQIDLDDIDALSQELFRWQFATAVAGAILQLNPFDQPDVEASKVESRKLTEAYERDGSLPELPVRFEGQGIRLHADDTNASFGTDVTDLSGWLRNLLDSLRPGDYFALLAYVDMNPAHEAELQGMRNAVRLQKSVATCVGFGPRFLHSTGQAYKGGPNTGVFIQVTADDADALKVPGRKVDFAVVKSAQAAGDLAVLVDRQRRALRVHLGVNVLEGLRTLRAAVEQASGSPTTPEEPLDRPALPGVARRRV